MKSLLLCCLAGLLLSASVPAAAAIWLGDYPTGTLAVPAQPVADTLPSLDLPDDETGLTESHPVVLAAPLPPVPEPMLVVMLACGLLLMMPGAWLAEWSRLGDHRRLLRGA
ncbi:hypothetical protein ACFFTM_20775 [Pseudoduganella plicata]|uniref:PEP-CTERM sorting domain-containing protein n=1 Tax=Pseudoduganella plicata TaxID=321984 RepID=A0A4P7BIH5_9BURK|nr:hypothetical protein [Pseudoduganella plicata]QBQ37289.1 hypothetical protein E1742_14710 [Pseudoduganella plicata]GGY97843.1 hypothetical protein GCM10007388_34140 [Pseudoduganella plicata]